MKRFGYCVKAALLMLLATPVLTTAGALAGVWAAAVLPALPGGAVAALVCLVPAALVFGLWALFGAKAKLPDTWGARFAPVWGAALYNVLAWVLGMALSHGSYDGGGWAVFFAMTLPWFLCSVLLMMGGAQAYFLALAAAAAAAAMGGLAFGARRKPARAGRRALAALCVCTLALGGAAAAQLAARSAQVLGRAEPGVAQVRDTLDLSVYRPFSRENRLAAPDAPPSLTIGENWPRLDGATAAYPVYAAVAQAVYAGLDEESAQALVACHTTPRAYERLIDGEIDVFFGAQPSPAQVQAAAEAGVEFTLTPIAKEAFVFFVHRDNPVSSLTAQQLRAIYRREVTNWAQLGGEDEAILAFQRPEGSGSQTIMQAAVMEGGEMAAPLREEVVSGMAGVIEQVASYRNYPGAIGYSFRWFATEMAPSDEIRLLAVDGAAPTAQAIRDGSYPFTVEVYAVTAGEPSAETQALLDWLCGEEGQALIEKTGYVPLAGQ